MPNAFSSLDQFKATYFQECDELLGSLEANLSGISAAADSKEALNAAFRAIHSIKGGAMMFGFTRLAGFAHTFETALDHARAGAIPLSREFTSRALAATDVLSDLAAAARGCFEPSVDHEAGARETLKALCRAAKAASNSKNMSVEPRPNGQSSAGTESHLEEGLAAGETRRFVIEFTPAPELLRRGLEPLVLIRNLRSLGQVKVTTNLSTLPDIRALDPGQAYLRFLIEIETAASRAAILDVFEFFSASALIVFRDEPAPSADSVIAAPSCGGMILTSAVQLWGADRPEGPTTSQIEAEVGVSEGVKDQPSFPVTTDRRNTMADRRVNSIRVELPRVERLVDLVGEITIAQAMVVQHLDQAIVQGNPALLRALSDLLHLSSTLQDSVMAIRAQRIGTIFGRLPRVLRESALQLGREVVLQTYGESTEIDKTIVEQLADPLMHIVRNAVDHGIEPPDVRQAVGKPPTGTIVLNAMHRGGRIVVEISDDGRGIDRGAVRERAVRMGVIGPDDILLDEEIDNLIFRPGLSTAAEVSGMSGRGVGMDVVYQNIQKLGGHVVVRSEPGCGTTTSISLPLTLAVLDAMQMRCCGETYLVPLNQIVECIVAPRPHLSRLPGGGALISVRGRQTPIVDLAKQFGLPDPQASERVHVLLVEVNDGRIIGLLVDEFCGHQQIVVKSIRDHFAALRGISGGTILGDGNVALILDVNQLAAEPLGSPFIPCRNHTAVSLCEACAA